MTRVASNPFTIQVQGTSSQTGLTFPSNGDSPVDAFVAFQFLNPHLDGMPIWGPNGQGTTFIWKCKYRAQAGYYTAWWWSNNGPYWWHNGNPDTYYGAHPFPLSGGGSGTNHAFEIGCDSGADATVTRAFDDHIVIKDNARWYTHALRTIRNANGTKKHILYIDMPSTANHDITEFNLLAHEGETNPPSPALTVGDSPWSTQPSSGRSKERLSGTIRHFKWFNKVLSEADTFAEAQSNTLVTAEGQSNIWWMKINPRPDDLLCDAGTGRNPVWAESTRATLWTG
jgi:hypothetical protein